MNDEILVADDILGLKHLANPGSGPLLLALLRDSSQRAHWSLLQRQNDAWVELRRLRGSGSERALDARIVEGDLWVAAELNGTGAVPIQLLHSPFSALLDGEGAEVRLQPQGTVRLSPAQEARVALAPTDQWNVAGPLLPKKWLFSPRFIAGDLGQNVLVNAADGQAMIASATQLPRESETFSLPMASSPQGLVHGSERWVAFLRWSEPGLPFWALNRYHTGHLPHPGTLRVQRGTGEEAELSALPGVGVVFDFQLLSSEKGDPWLFALKDEKVGTAVVALQLAGDGWKVRGTLELDHEVSLFSVVSEASRWTVVFAVPGASGVVLHHQAWALSP